MENVLSFKKLIFLCMNRIRMKCIWPIWIMIACHKKITNNNSPRKIHRMEQIVFCLIKLIKFTQLQYSKLGL